LNEEIGTPVGQKPAILAADIEAKKKGEIQKSFIERRKKGEGRCRREKKKS